MNIFSYNKIIILGNNGSGKSWLAKELAAATGLPLIHLDAHFWRPNWGMPAKEEWLEKNKQFIAGERWIIDGNCSHGGTMELRFAAADLAVILDVNRWVCLAGLLQRNGKPRPDRPQANDEVFDLKFFRFCWFMLLRRGKVMREYQALHEKYPGTEVYVIKGRKNINRQLHQWKEDLS